MSPAQPSVPNPPLLPEPVGCSKLGASGCERLCHLLLSERTILCSSDVPFDCQDQEAQMELGSQRKAVVSCWLPPALTQRLSHASQSPGRHCSQPAPPLSCHCRPAQDKDLPSLPHKLSLWATVSAGRRCWAQTLEIFSPVSLELGESPSYLLPPPALSQGGSDFLDSLSGVLLSK